MFVYYQLVFTEFQLIECVLQGSSWTDFKPQIEKLPNLLPNFSIVAWDPPGYGKSIPPKRNFGVDFYHRDAEAAVQLMQRLNFKLFDILGWSDGGITGMLAAGNFSRSVRKLVIWGANAYIHPNEIKIYESIRDVNKWSERMREPMEKVYGKEGFATLWSDWVDALLKIYNEKEGNLCKDELRKITAQTLVLHGAKDPMIVPEHVPYLLNNIKGSDIFVFNEGKHNIHLKYADEFNRLVADFLLK